MEKISFHILAEKCPRKDKKVFCEACKYNNGWDGSHLQAYCHFLD